MVRGHGDDVNSKNVVQGPQFTETVFPHICPETESTITFEYQPGFVDSIYLH